MNWIRWEMQILNIAVLGDGICMTHELACVTYHKLTRMPTGMFSLTECHPALSYGAAWATTEVRSL